MCVFLYKLIVCTFMYSLHPDTNREGVGDLQSVSPWVSPVPCSGRLHHCKDPSLLLALTTSSQHLLLAVSVMSMVSSVVFHVQVLHTGLTVQLSLLSTVPQRLLQSTDTPQHRHATALFTWILGLFPDVVRSKAFYEQW